jgi:hypothetical protein
MANGTFNLIRNFWIRLVDHHRNSYKIELFKGKGKIQALNFCFKK